MIFVSRASTPSPASEPPPAQRLSHNQPYQPPSPRRVPRQPAHHGNQLPRQPIETTMRHPGSPENMTKQLPRQSVDVSLKKLPRQYHNGATHLPNSGVHQYTNNGHINGQSTTETRQFNGSVSPVVASYHMNNNRQYYAKKYPQNDLNHNQDKTSKIPFQHSQAKHVMHSESPQQQSACNHEPSPFSYTSQPIRITPSSRQPPKNQPPFNQHQSKVNQHKKDKVVSKHAKSKDTKHKPIAPIIQHTKEEFFYYSPSEETDTGSQTHKNNKHVTGNQGNKPQLPVKPNHVIKGPCAARIRGSDTKLVWFSMLSYYTNAVYVYVSNFVLLYNQGILMLDLNIVDVKLSNGIDAFQYNLVFEIAKYFVCIEH